MLYLYCIGVSTRQHLISTSTSLDGTSGFVADTLLEQRFYSLDEEPTVSASPSVRTCNLSMHNIKFIYSVHYCPGNALWSFCVPLAGVPAECRFSRCAAGGLLRPRMCLNCLRSGLSCSSRVFTHDGIKNNRLLPIVRIIRFKILISPCYVFHRVLLF